MIDATNITWKSLIDSLKLTGGRAEWVCWKGLLQAAWDNLMFRPVGWAPPLQNINPPDSHCRRDFFF